MVEMVVYCMHSNPVGIPEGARDKLMLWLRHLAKATGLGDEIFNARTTSIYKGLRDTTRPQHGLLVLLHLHTRTVDVLL